MNCQVIGRSNKRIEYNTMKIKRHMPAAQSTKLYIVLQNIITNGAGTFLICGAKRPGACYSKLLNENKVIKSFSCSFFIPHSNKKQQICIVTQERSSIYCWSILEHIAYADCVNMNTCSQCLLGVYRQALSRLPASKPAVCSMYILLVWNS